AVIDCQSYFESSVIAQKALGDSLGITERDGGGIGVRAIGQYLHHGCALAVQVGGKIRWNHDRQVGATAVEGVLHLAVVIDVGDDGKIARGRKAADVLPTGG